MTFNLLININGCYSEIVMHLDRLLYKGYSVNYKRLSQLKVGMNRKLVVVRNIL